MNGDLEEEEEEEKIYSSTINSKGLAGQLVPFKPPNYMVFVARLYVSV